MSTPHRLRRSLRVSLTLLLLAASGGSSAAQTIKNDAPRITTVFPLGSAPGTTVKVKVRGVKLDTALLHQNTAVILERAGVGA